MSRTRPVIFDHDGGIDDYIALVMLASTQASPQVFDSIFKKYLKKQNKEEEVSQTSTETETEETVTKIKLLGVTVVEADCFKEPCIECCRRVLCLYHDVCPDISLNVPVAASSLQGTAAPFPSDFRKDSFVLLDNPILHTPDVNEVFAKRNSSSSVGEIEKKYENNGHELLAQLVLNSPDPVTIVVTGPVSNIAYALKKYGNKFSDNVEQIIAMSGAVRVQGNVFAKNLPENSVDVDSSQEWNVFWDSPAAKTVFESPDMFQKVVLVPLDATNKVPVNSELVHRFGNEAVMEVEFELKNVSNKKITKLLPTTLALFVGGSWSQCTYFERWAASQYYGWDVCCAAYLIAPSIFIKEKILAKVTVEATPKHISEGRTILHEDETEDKNKNMIVLLDVDTNAFYDLAVASALVC